MTAPNKTSSMFGAQAPAFEPGQAAYSSAQESDGLLSPDQIIKQYLEKHLDVYGELRRGWENPQGDIHFQKRLEKVDQSQKNPRGRRDLFRIMLQIADQIDEATSAFTISRPKDPDVRAAILDLCMAPGGFAFSALKRSPFAKLCGIALPPELGGFEMVMRKWNKDKRVSVHFGDITMLVGEMGFDVPAGHVDAGIFSEEKIFEGQKFDLVLCDGQILRNQPRSEYREPREARRLTASQLVFAMQHIREGGTLVQLFKPKPMQAKQSSFYMVAKGVRSDSNTALRAVAEWKEIWAEATFTSEALRGNNEAVDTGDSIDDEIWMERKGKGGDKALAVLDEFGPTLLKMAEPVIAIQAAALRSVACYEGLGTKENQGLAVKQVTM
ncbi:hypothetical protein QBC35DRAFT_467803 [Podospora australis]|uniref:Ribosomal RNA methyltransferase FtsJ domain-containing protein n=1 Tax=Podospora australis TaxID=1536484 RepID=A0AAN7ABS2_9PEZI|nr:hypothetical protein QBC35DRAFT_467803 [Podospora australis]